MDPDPSFILNPDPSFIAAGIGLCLIVLAFTSAVDAAFTSISRHRLNALLDDGAPRAHTVSRLIDDPYRFKATIILLNASVTIAATAFTLYLTHAYSLWVQVGGLVLLLLAILIVSEALPKTWAVRNPDATALALARPLSVVSRILWPMIAIVGLLSKPLAQLVQGKDAPAMPLVTEEEIRLLVNVGEEEGLIEHGEREMIEGIFSFGETLVREIMVPRVDMVAIEIDTSLDTVLALVIEEGHSRIPVFEETIDTIVGMLYVKDLFPILQDQSTPNLPIREILRPAHFIPETMMVDALLREMKQHKVHMAIIVDEYGGTAGLATIEDLLEEIVGEIQDEYDVEEPWIQILGDTQMIVDARVSIDDINDMTDLNIESKDADRIGGLVYEHLGRVPQVDDVIVLEGATVTVLSVQGVRPEKLRIDYQHPLELERNEQNQPADEDEITLSTRPDDAALKVDPDTAEETDDPDASDAQPPQAARSQDASQPSSGREDQWSNVTTQP